MTRLLALMCIILWSSLGWAEAPQVLDLDSRSDVVAVGRPFDLYLDLDSPYEVVLESNMSTRDTEIKEVIICVDASGYPAWKLEEGIPIRIVPRRKKGDYSGGVKILGLGIGRAQVFRQRHGNTCHFELGPFGRCPRRLVLFG